MVFECSAPHVDSLLGPASGRAVRQGRAGCACVVAGEGGSTGLCEGWPSAECPYPYPPHPFTPPHTRSHHLPRCGACCPRATRRGPSPRPTFPHSPLHTLPHPPTPLHTSRPGAARAAYVRRGGGQGLGLPRACGNSVRGLGDGGRQAWAGGRAGGRWWVDAGPHKVHPPRDIGTGHPPSLGAAVTARVWPRRSGQAL
jgi:hypothetical protein